MACVSKDEVARGSITASWFDARSFFPSPLVGEGAERRSREAGEGDSRVIGIFPLTRLDLTSFDLATLSHEGRGKERRKHAITTARSTAAG
jgi:hypothetical protein